MQYTQKGRGRIAQRPLLLLHFDPISQDIVIATVFVRLCL